jgi:tRNA (mo5U34)-methyltransferase
MEFELGRQRLPADLAGKSVLDIGAYDGFYSFEAERRGARRVVAIDHVVWLQDVGPDAGELDASLLNLEPDGLPPVGAPLPGKRAFNAARELLGSRVESVVADFMHYDLDALGSFDLVLFLGVLYHMMEPLTALRRVASLTHELAIIESEVIVVPGKEELPLTEFVPDARLNSDLTNWWVPSIPALRALAFAAGFERVELVDGPSPGVPAPAPIIHRARATIHAFKHA